MAGIAAFIDGENVSPDHAGAILRTLQPLGPLDILRVYGNIGQIPRWDAQPRFRTIHSGTGKNATDILLTVDAMEAALASGFGTIVIGSSDGDYHHLATRLRETGRTVIGIGEVKTPEVFRDACSRFIELNPRKPDAPVEQKRPSRQATDFDYRVRDVISCNSKNGSGVRLADLDHLMWARHEIKICSVHEGNWRTYLASREKLFDLDPKGPDARVRFKKTGFACLA